MKALDLFCGLGGWSDGLAAEGFDVTGVEIEPKIAALYKHRVIVSDVCDLKPEEFKGYDLIVGSPPCRDFCKMTRFKHWKRPADPASAYQLVETYLNFVKVAQPQYWLLENVPGLLPWIKLKPRCKAHLSKTMVRCFWGTFPTFLIPTDLRKRNIMDIQGPLRAWERAKIPMAVSRALGQSVLASKSELK